MSQTIHPCNMKKIIKKFLKKEKIPEKRFWFSSDFQLIDGKLIVIIDKKTCVYCCC